MGGQVIFDKWPDSYGDFESGEDEYTKPDVFMHPSYYKCDKCQEEVSVLCFDNSSGEYSPNCYCKRCLFEFIAKM